MKTIIASITLMTLLLSCSSTSISNQSISGHIENNSEYLGGANPPEALLEALTIYNPSANQHFYVRNAANYAPFTSIITNFQTDSNGNFSTDLPQGHYAVICQEKYDFEQSPQATTDCNYLLEPDFMINVVANQQNYSQQFTKKRNNCTKALVD